jgi:hypothetical protein
MQDHIFTLLGSFREARSGIYPPAIDWSIELFLIGNVP